MKRPNDRRFAAAAHATKNDLAIRAYKGRHFAIVAEANARQYTSAAAASQYQEFHCRKQTAANVVGYIAIF